MAPFTYLYPFDPASLMRIAYYFDFDYQDGRRDDTFARGAVDLARAWSADGDRGTLEVTSAPDGSITILDTRPPRPPRRAALQGWKAAVYLACDRAQPIGNLTSVAKVRADEVSESSLREFLEHCVEHRLAVTNGRSWLSVAVHVPERVQDQESDGWKEHGAHDSNEALQST
jgi:hypothetical protein